MSIDHFIVHWKIQNLNEFYLDQGTDNLPRILNHFILNSIHGHGDAVLPINYVIKA